MLLPPLACYLFYLCQIDDEKKFSNSYKGGVMRKMFGITAVALLAVSASVVPTQAGVSVQFSVAAHSEYVGFDDLEDGMDWDNMIVVDNNRIGVWVTGPSGQWVFRCRNMWYDNACDEWRYGPWWYDYYLSYGSCHGIRFHIFMNQHYPRYHERYFYHDNGLFFRYTNRHYDRGERDYRNSGHNALRWERNEPAVHREKQSVQQVNPARGGERTTVITREPSQPVRIDGGNRIDRTDRTYGNRSGGTQTRVVRERSTTRVQPSSNGTRTTRTETRREMPRR
jgi:hypothetical protein